MSAMGWVSLFAQFAGVAKELVEQFAEKHPELRDPPKEEESGEIDKGIDAMIAAKFPNKS